MHAITLIGFILYSYSAFLFIDTRPVTDMNTIRQEYIEAINNGDKTDDLLKKLSNATLDDPLLIAYRGATEALKAKHAFNPYTKLNYLKKSNESLQKAIQMRPQDIEIRFLRFSIQHYLPAFLRQDKELQQDKSVIVSQINDPSLDRELQQSIGKFMIESGRCTQQEVKRIQEVLGS
jgi:hypothetical protein